MKSLSMGALRMVLLGLAVCHGYPVWAQQASDGSAHAADVDALQKLALQEGEAGKTDEAIRDYQRALELHPEWKEGWWNLGSLQYSANQFADATAAFKRVVEFAPTLGVAWALLGLSEYEIKAFDDALAALERAQALGIKDDAQVERVATYHLTLLLVRGGQFERASDLLLETFGTGTVSEQVKFVLGLATLRIPLLPEQVDPSQEALVLAAGGVASAGKESITLFPAFLRSYPDIPYTQYAYGLALVKAGRSTEAIEHFREENRISPVSPLPWIEIGRVELGQGNAEQARHAAEKAVALDAGSKAAQQLLAASLDALGVPKEAAKEKDKAGPLPADQEPPEQRIVQRYASAANSANPTLNAQEDRDRWEQSMREFSIGDYTSAGRDLKDWLQRNPGNGTGWAVLGLSEFALKDYDNALIHLERGQQLGVSGNAKSVQSAKYTLGVLLIRAGRFEAATETLMSAWKNGPLDDKVQFALGLALLRRAELPGQVKAEEYSLVDAAGKIAIELQQSQYDGAFAQLKPLIEQYPKMPFLHYIYGTALLSLSEFDEAAAQMRAETAISPSSALPYLRLASIALREHRPAEAAPWAKRALELAPESAEAHYLLGRAALETGDDAIALHELEIASKLNPRSPEVHFNLAKAYARAKQPEKAEQERATFSQLNEIAERERSQHGTQIYAGPHDAGQATTTASPQ
jgi:tetratricopeptide (TPR) repeat protein